MLKDSNFILNFSYEGEVLLSRWYDFILRSPNKDFTNRTKTFYCEIIGLDVYDFVTQSVKLFWLKHAFGVQFGRFHIVSKHMGMKPNTWRNVILKFDIPMQSKLKWTAQL